MHSFILQDWSAFAGLSGATFTQDESGYLDLAPFQDVIIYLDCRETSASAPTIAFETAPTRDDSLFQPLVSMTMTSGGLE